MEWSGRWFGLALIVWRAGVARGRQQGSSTETRRLAWRQVRASSFWLEGEEVFLLVDGDYAVAAHDGAEAGQVRMAAAVIEGGDFEVVLGADHARGLQAEHAAGGVGGVSVRVWRAAGDEEGDAAADFGGLAGEGPGRGAVDAEGGLVGFAMDVGERDGMESRHCEFEEVEDAAGFVAGLLLGGTPLSRRGLFVVSFLPSGGW